MMAERREETLRRRRRMRLIKGLAMGSAAIGLPALANLLVSRRARRLPTARWGSGHRYAWRHGEVVFQRLGEGDTPIVLLHAFGPGHSAGEWRKVAEQLAQRHRILAPDLLGWGQSEHPDVAYDGELYIRLLRDFLEDVVGKKTVVVAAGLSAAYAVQLAVDRPDLIRAVGLVVPFGIGHGEDEPDIKDAIVHRLLRLPILGTAALNLYTSRSGIAGYLRREAFANESLVDDRLIAEHYRTSHLPGAHHALAAYVSGYLNHRVRAVLASLEQPVWLAWGRDAAGPPVATADLWLQRLPHAELDVFERCGALPHAESPEELVHKLRLFLTSLGL